MKEAVLQVRIESDLKDKAESLYKDLGTSFAEMVRIMAKKSVDERQLPFRVQKLYKGKAFGIFKKYGNEKTANMTLDEMRQIVRKNHGKNN